MFKPVWIAYAILTILLFDVSQAQDISVDGRNYSLFKTQDDITIDGVLDEEVWQQAQQISHFTKHFPVDRGQPINQTQVMMTYDDDFLYIAARLFTGGDEPTVQTLERNFNWARNDNFTVDIDPFGDEINGFHFSVNAMGAQREGMISRGSSVSQDWDNGWFSEVKQYEDYWTVEIAIPFKSLRYTGRSKNWNINFSRNDLGNNEQSTWQPVPRNFNIHTLSYTGEINWDEEPPPAGLNIAFIPYVSAGFQRDFLLDSSYNSNYDMGLDAKIAVTTSLNLDITINPDFAQTQADQLQTNLSRFSLFLPEQRQFFLENNDLFAQVGFSRIRPFFSRRIGLYQGRQIPIIAGARLSGKFNDDFRIGIMNMQTAEESALNLSTQNYSVLAAQYDVLSRSNLAFIFVNRQGKNFNDLTGNDYNRVAGLDFNFSSADNSWRGIAFLHRSFSPGEVFDPLGNTVNRDNAFSHAVWLMYSDDKFTAQWNHEYIEEDYNAEVGYVQRTNVWRLEPSFEHRFYSSDSDRINFYSYRLYLNRYETLDGMLTDNHISVRNRLRFLNTANIDLTGHSFYIRLLDPIDITRTGGEPLPAMAYHNYEGAISFNTDGREALSANGSLIYGEFYNGEKLTYRSGITYLLRPYGNINIGYERNIITLPEPYNSADLHLINTNLNISLSRDLFISSRLQFSSQLDLFSTNTRLQWRFSPMSDLFLVYTDNYGTQNPLEPVQRSLIFKLNYWFNS